MLVLKIQLEEHSKAEKVVRDYGDVEALKSEICLGKARDVQNFSYIGKLFHLCHKLLGRMSF